VDGVFFAYGIEHLFDEEGEAAGLVIIASVGRGEVIVKALKGLFVAEGFRGVVESEDFPGEAGDGFLALGGNALNDVVTALDGIPRQGRLSEAAGVEGIEDTC